MVPKMRMHIVFAVLLVFVSHALGSDVDQEKRTIEEELLSSLFTSKSKHSAVLWRLTLLKVCATLDSLDEAWQPESETQPEEEEEYFRFRLPPVSQSADELYDLRNLCRVLQPREVQDVEDYLDLDQNSDNPLKRKSPYILKRQLHTSKQARRPYILKRSSLFY
ncbi:neurotensin/neuromedin N isoform X2 [Clupea harengus]|uniref:Neurotensin/neuromedin N n=1 Tax=Clupea harengus TaxID=7950 RepID=A0A6P8EQY5_CLUHA|nr:neurotensin/neuromedin N isoform X2 [Clupea harengus]